MNKNQVKGRVKEVKGKIKEVAGKVTGVSLLSASTITGDEVCNLDEEKLGKIQDLMLDLTEGKIRYAVLTSGGFLSMGDRLFAVPWKALKLDKANHRFILDADM